MSLELVISTLISILIIFIGLLFFHQVVLRLISKYYHFPIPVFLVRYIDNPLRRRIQPPKKVVSWIDIQKNMEVLEIGPGPGTFTIEAARRLGIREKLYAVDIQPKVISMLNERLQKENIENVISKVASASELPFPDEQFDRVFMVGVLGEIPDKIKALREAHRVLRNDGLFAIGELVPDPDYPRTKLVINWCEQVNFKLVNKFVIEFF